MTLLPREFQGYLHVIEIPLNGSARHAFVCYLRPQQINGKGTNDMLDTKILEAIRQRCPAASKRIYKSILFESVEIATARFRGCYSYPIYISLHTPLNMDPLGIGFYQDPKSWNIELNIYTVDPIETFFQNIRRHPDSSEFDNWNKKLDPYEPLLDTIYPVEIDHQLFNTFKNLPPVIDIKVVKKNLYSK